MSFLKSYKFLFPQSDQNLDVNEVLVMIVTMFYSFPFNFAFCNYGEYLAHRFELVAEEICKIDWYLLPLGMQQMLIVVNANAQQPTVIRGYGNITCTRETLKRVQFHSFD